MRIMLFFVFCCTLVVSVINLSGCTRESKEAPSEERRIQVKEYIVLEGHAFFIISIDGREFATTGDGGIYPLDK